MGGAAGEDAIDAAAGAALTPIAPLETQLDFDSLKWKMASVFRKATKGINFISAGLQTIVDQYADKAFSTLINTFGDRTWLPQSDLTLVFFAGVKTTFPEEILVQTDAQVLEGVIVSTYERAFDEARVMPLLWECVEKKVEGKKMQNKVYNALEQGRSIATKAVCGMADSNSLPSVEKVQRFITAWVNSTLEPVAAANRDDPSAALPEDKAIQMFQQLIASEGLPTVLSKELAYQGIQLPRNYPFINEVVHLAYIPFMERAARRARSTPKTAYCWYFYQGTCGFSQGCMYAHSEAELPPHMVLTAPWSVTAPPSRTF